MGLLQEFCSISKEYIQQIQKIQLLLENKTYSDFSVGD